MDLLAHLVFGFWVYKKYKVLLPIFLCCIFDIDHVIGYFYDQRKYQYKWAPNIYKFAYRPRSWFHSFTGLIIMQAIFSAILPWKIVLMALSSHLLMDAVDVYGISILPPLIKEKATGPLPVSYVWENPEKSKHNEKAHVISIMFIILFSLMIILKIY